MSEFEKFWAAHDPMRGYESDVRYNAVDLEQAWNAALEAAVKVCRVTPPYPFRPSIEAAHAILALKEQSNEVG